MIIFFVYLFIGYWAVGKTIYADKVRFGSWASLFTQQVIMACLLGWILIPIAIIKSIFGH